MNLKNTVSKTPKGLKYLQLAGVGREYIEKRLAEMQSKKETSETSFQTNGRKTKK
jgi:cytochrome c553